MNVPAATVKELRQRTAAGFMDCRKALEACENEIEAAADWLRKKGLLDAAKKANRVAAEGLVGVAGDSKRRILVEINSETDFVARGEDFQTLVTDAAIAIAAHGSAEGDLTAVPLPDGSGTVGQRVQKAVAKVGENLVLRRAGEVATAEGLVASYVHSAVAPGLGRIGVLVSLVSEAGENEALAALGKQIAMHIAASQPVAVDESGIAADVAARERSIYAAQAAESGKPAEIIEKMIEGRWKKFLKDNCLLQQGFVVDPDVTVGKALERAAGEIGAAVGIHRFLRFSVGEGIEKQTSDFAEEVEAAARG